MSNSTGKPDSYDNRDVRSSRQGGSVSYFDAVARDYFQRYQEKSPGGYALRVRKQRLFELMDRSGGRVLDVGCGPGVMVQELVNLGYECWGIDVSSKMVEECRNNFGHIAQAHFSVGDATRLDFPDNFFDAVVCMGVIDHTEDSEASLREMARVVKSNGRLLISFPNLISPYAAWKNFVFYPTVALLRPLYYQLFRRPQPPSLYNRGVIHFLSLFPSIHKLHTAKRVAENVTQYGVEVSEIVYFNFNVVIPPLDEIFPGLAMRIAERLEPCRFQKLKWLGSGFILTARKLDGSRKGRAFSGSASRASGRPFGAHDPGPGGMGARRP